MIGNLAGKASSGGNNTFIGALSGYEMTTGSSNTFLGRWSGCQNGLDLRTASNHIVFSDGAGCPRLVADNNGDVSIGRVASGAATTVNGWTIYNTGQLYGYSSGTGNSDTVSLHDNNGTNTAAIDADGDFVTISDRRKKENIADMDAGLAEVMQLQPRKFDWINSGLHVDSGFIAQEVQEVFPSAVVENYQGFLMMKDKQLIPLLTKALQEAVARIETLEAAIEELQNP